MSEATAPKCPFNHTPGGGTSNTAFLVGTKDGPNADAAECDRFEGCVKAQQRSRTGRPLACARAAAAHRGR